MSFGLNQKPIVVLKVQDGIVVPVRLRMTFSFSHQLRHATLVGSLLTGAAFPSRESHAQESALQLPDRPLPRTPRSKTEIHTEIPTEEFERLSPYLASLPHRTLTPQCAKTLIAQNDMRDSREGVVLDKYHLIFASWDERGIVFDKSILRSPRASHSAAIALGTTVTASTDHTGETKHHLTQNVTVVSFLPASVQGIREKVRIDLFTVTDPNGAQGVSWQGLDFLLKPNKYLGGTSITVSVSNAIPVSDTAYWAVVRRAEELDRQGKPYHVLSSCGLRRGTENCITGVAGIMHHIPGASPPPATGPLRGQEATDLLARAVVEAGGASPNDLGHYEAAQDAWVLREFVRVTPSAQSGISWYRLHK